MNPHAQVARPRVPVRHLGWYGMSDGPLAAVLTYCGTWLDQHGDHNRDVLGRGAPCPACAVEAARRRALAGPALAGPGPARDEWARTVKAPPIPTRMRHRLAPLRSGS